MGKEISLPSGAKAVINAAPFSEAFKLWQACAQELAQLKISADTELNVDFLKNLFCIATSSEKIEAALRPCFRRCLYAGSKIDESSFEKEDARQDYFPVMEEVLRTNILPFLKGQLQKWGINLGQVTESIPALKSRRKTNS